MRAQRQPGPEQMTAGEVAGAGLGQTRAQSDLCSSAPPPRSSEGHCDMNPGQGRGRTAPLESTDLSIYML